MHAYYSDFRTTTVTRDLLVLEAHCNLQQSSKSFVKLVKLKMQLLWMVQSGAFLRLIPMAAQVLAMPFLEVDESSDGHLGC